MARSIAGLFNDRDSAEAAIRDLKAAGFDASRMGIVTQDKGVNQDLAEEHGTRATEGAVTGGLIGGSIGALMAATGALVIPGIGPFISGGILATALVGGTAGWLVGGLAGLGIPREEAEYYEGQVQQGRTLVTVDAQGREAEARSILLRNGAEDLQDRGFGGYDTTDMAGAVDTTLASAPLSDRAATTLADTSVSDTSYVAPDVRASGRADTMRQGEEDLRVPVVEEELVAGKRAVEEGRVHVHKDVVEEKQSVTVPVQREQIRVERVAVQGDAANVADAFVERDIDVPLKGEEVVVGKRAHVVEEVRIRKDQVTEDQQVSDTVRKERVYIDGVDDTATASRDDYLKTDASDAASSVAGTARDATDSVGSAIRNAAEGAKDTVEDAGNAVGDTVRRATDR